MKMNILFSLFILIRILFGLSVSRTECKVTGKLVSTLFLILKLIREFSFPPISEKEEEEYK